MVPFQVEGSHLSGSVNTSIGAAGQQNRPILPAEFPQACFENALNCPSIRLTLRSEELSAIVGENNFVTCHFQ
jgi:hypothetical protein